MSGPPWRSASATRGFRPLAVEFVGTADVSRTAFCKLLAISMADPQLAVFGSSGLLARVGDEVDPAMAVALGRIGLACEQVRSRPLDETILSGSDLVLTMDSRQREFVANCWPNHAAKVFVLGRFVTQLGEFGMRSSVQLSRALSAIDPDAADPESDVPDPRGWGDEATRSVARRLGAMTAAMLRALGVLAAPGADSPEPRRGTPG
ncbi:Protein-tyrosine-phosphatase [Propionibacterium cyclohexanicum]|uniref:Protein-tyrosine-phosphatase n=1 Tax=Propionibacterium cyclohexanicum TaxID=64702 RepID=A0A1H9TB22_9ACTN|nr:hypothetical protein [Propionibacterium cyclohexanicum]SER94328.1 Protein-tyrosine-phosphatase [Propionibacterium cyclohexanicum]